MPSTEAVSHPAITGRGRAETAAPAAEPNPSLPDYVEGFLAVLRNLTVGETPQPQARNHATAEIPASLLIRSSEIAAAISSLQSSLRSLAKDDAATAEHGADFSSDPAQRFESCCRLAEFFEEHHKWDLAENFAVLALKSLPPSSRSPHIRRPIRVLDRALVAKGMHREAALCTGLKHLPEYILNKYFAEFPRSSCSSHTAGRGSVQKLPAFPEASIPLNLPLHLPHHHEEVRLAYRQSEIKVAEAYTSVVPGGRLWYEGQMVVWDHHGRVVADLQKGLSMVAQASAENCEPVQLSGRVCLLGSRNPDNYYHWMNDVLPRLGVLKKSGIPIDSIDRFVVKRPKTRFHKETLAHFGITEDRLHFIQDSCYVHADEIVIPSFGGGSMGLQQGKWNPDFLKTEFLDGAPPAPHRRIYISRGTTGVRAILNEPELIASLTAHDFEVLKAENLTLKQQARYFSEAAVVMGAHGAGFTNTAFCQPGTKVIELFSGFMAPCFWAISTVSGLQHHALYCGDTVSPAETMDKVAALRSRRDRNKAGFQVDVVEVEKFLAFAGLLP